MPDALPEVRPPAMRRCWQYCLVDPDDLLAELDAEQREVALATRGPVCVLAGAGPGRRGRSLTVSPMRSRPA